MLTISCLWSKNVLPVVLQIVLVLQSINMDKLTFLNRQLLPLLRTYLFTNKQHYTTPVNPKRDELCIKQLV